MKNVKLFIILGTVLVSASSLAAYSVNRISDADIKAAEEYWTPERIANTKPMSLPPIVPELESSIGKQVISESSPDSNDFLLYEGFKAALKKSEKSVSEENKRIWFKLSDAEFEAINKVSQYLTQEKEDEITIPGSDDQASQNSDNSLNNVVKISEEEQSDALKYWTPKRIANAKPFPMPRFEVSEEESRRMMKKIDQIQSNKEYWTPERLANTKPFPLPQVEIPEEMREEWRRMMEEEPEQPELVDFVMIPESNGEFIMNKMSPADIQKAEKYFGAKTTPIDFTWFLFGTFTIGGSDGSLVKQEQFDRLAGEARY